MLGEAGEVDGPAAGGWYRFERGKRRGEVYDLAPLVCERPLCGCTNLYLVCTPRDPIADGAGTGLAVTLDVVEQKWLRQEPRDRAADSLGRDLARDLDAEDWQALRTLFSDAKFRLTREADLASLDDADFPRDEIESESLLVAYDEIVPFDESLEVEAGGERFFVDDLYCLRPHCLCRDVHLLFVPVPPDPPAGGVQRLDASGETHVVLHLGSGRWQLEERGKTTVDVAAMMAAFFDQLDPRAMLKERRRVLRAMYRNYLRRIGRSAAPSAAGRKVGRNEPCPCGSGKKYKKCCLPKEVGR